MKCKSCSSKDIAKILYGLPIDLDAIEKQIDKGEIIPGGCCVSDNDPKWKCNSCGYRWGKQRD